MLQQNVTLQTSQKNVFHLQSLMNLRLLNKQSYLLLNLGKTFVSCSRTE